MPDPALARKILRDAELICTADEVQAAIRRVAAEITSRLADAYPLVLTAMGGGVFFAGQILPLLRFPLDLDYIHATRYGAQTVGASIEWRVPPPPGVRGRTVLVLDDILDGGNTMAAVRDRVLGQGAGSFLCAVLTEKVLPVPKPIAPDFAGLRLPDKFVFGCGMDARGYWRNLPEIYALKED
ncbi:MAG: hypoxanthine-guanine phosphoribosyltransferase [Proteobacteria bacterium]|nr:hypoxanthine-guanine phosphoribosyltransferase [Pseudomonadota bacterium]